MAAKGLLDFSISELSVMTGHSRRSLSAWFDDARLPHRRHLNAKRFKLADVLPVLAQAELPTRAAIDIAEAKARKMEASAGLAELDLKAMREAVVEVSVAEGIIRAERRIVRERVLRFPDEVAEAVERTPGIDAKRHVLMQGLVGLLAELSTPRELPLPEVFWDDGDERPGEGS